MLKNVSVDDCMLNAFKPLIDAGYNPEDYMYMYTDNNVSYFKHIDTRKYVEIKQA